MFVAKYYKGDFISDMNICGWEVTIYIDDTGAERSGYLVFGKFGPEGEWRKIPIIISKGYYMLSFPYTQEKKNQTKQIPLHKVIFAYYCGWRGYNVMAGGEVHHINRNKLDNRIDNLIYCSKSDHTKIHDLIRKIIKTKYVEFSDFDKDQQELIKLVSKGITLRDNCHCAKGYDMKKFSDIIWED